MSSGVVASYMLATKKSQYHDSCVPKPVNRPAEPSAPAQKEGDFNKCNAITQSEIWKQSVHSERRCLKNWEENWGFIADYDSKGNLREKEELPEKSNMFSDDLPNTNAGNYGFRLKSEPGRTMQSLEQKFFSGDRRKKLDPQMICY